MHDEITFFTVILIVEIHCKRRKQTKQTEYFHPTFARGRSGMQFVSCLKLFSPNARGLTKRLGLPSEYVHALAVEAQRLFLLQLEHGAQAWMICRPLRPRAKRSVVYEYFSRDV